MSTALLAAGTVGAALAFAANVWAAFTGPRALRPMYATIAALAAVYAGAYAAQTLGAIDEHTRVGIATGFGPVAWLVVWTAPAVRSTVVYHRHLDQMRRMLNRVDEVTA